MRCLFCGLFSSRRRLAAARRGAVDISRGAKLALSSDTVRKMYRLPFGAEEELGDPLHAREPDACSVVFRDIDI